MPDSTWGSFSDVQTRMTEYEYLELYVTVKQATAADGMNCLVIISAYLVAIYVAAERLSSLFLWPIAILYTVFLAGPTISAARGFLAMDALVIDFASRIPDSSLIPPLIGRSAYVTSGVVVVAWLFSLIFTIYISRRASASKGSA